MLKKRKIVDKSKEIEKLANQLADKPYGDDAVEDDNMIRTTITMPISMLHQLEDIARENKRKNIGLKSVSALVREGITYILNK